MPIPLSSPSSSVLTLNDALTADEIKKYQEINATVRPLVEWLEFHFYLGHRLESVILLFYYVFGSILVSLFPLVFN